jgi:hypothetical protein
MKRKTYTRLIGVLVTDKVYREIKKITNDARISVTEFIRDLIDRELTSREGKETLK